MHPNRHTAPPELLGTRYSSTIFASSSLAETKTPGGCRREAVSTWSQYVQFHDFHTSTWAQQQLQIISSPELKSATGEVWGVLILCIGVIVRS